MDRKNSKARIAANNRYNEKAYDRINIAIPKGRKTTVEVCAKADGTTVNGLVNALLREKAGLTEEEWKHVPEADEI